MYCGKKWKLGPVVVPVICLVILSMLGCGPGQESKRFDELMESNMGVGISFGMSQGEVARQIGFATVVEEQADQRRMVTYYVPEEIAAAADTGVTLEMITPATPQLRLIFVDDALTQVYSHYDPLNEDLPLPPVIIEYADGVKIGNRLSDFVSTLGQVEDPEVGNEWVFTHESGKELAIFAEFVELTNSPEQLCNTLQVTFFGDIKEYRGEQFEKNENWRENIGLEPKDGETQ